MIYLTTGSNGAGKTLNVLKWVREQSVKEARPVYYNGRFEMVAEFGWLKFEFSKWQELPDGAILLVDECHNDIPVRPNSSPVPDSVKMLAEHRRRGFDFYFITQHPQNIDLFVRRLIGSPGWHRHLKRNFGVDMVSCLEWSSVKSDCEKSGAGKDAKVSMIPFPKEVYGWYKSAMLHTGKKSIPRQVYFLAAAVVLVPLAFWFAYSRITAPKPALAAISGPTAGASAARSSAVSDAPKALTVDQYVQSFTPRIAGLPSTAPRYDDVTKAVQAPKPSACIFGSSPGHKKDRCDCFSQQATKLNTPFDICKQIALGGWFDDSAVPVASVPRHTAAEPARLAQVLPASIALASAPLVQPVPVAVASPDADVLEFMAKRRIVR